MQSVSGAERCKEKVSAMSKAEIDFSTIVENPMLSVRVGYVLVIEWLPEQDEHGREEVRTGEQLVTWLQEKFGQGKSEYCRCYSAADVEARLSQAVQEIGFRGVPVVHIEAHGGVDGFVGPNGAGGPATLTWRALGAMLRPINVASRFNLLLIGAACHGEGLLLAIEADKPMPFTAVVGYTDTVNPASLKDSMIELYRQLFSNNEELSAAVEEADRQHRFPSDSVLRPTSTMVLALESFIDTAQDRIGIDTRDDYALDIATEVLRGNGYDLSVLPYSTAKVMGPKILRAALETWWRKVWMMQEFSENTCRFAIDFDRVVEIASQLFGASFDAPDSWRARPGALAWKTGAKPSRTSASPTSNQSSSQ
jgi:hypothetical protein